MIEVRGLTKIYPPDTVALRDISLKLPDGQFATVIGPSGAGKSSLLRCLNGLAAPTAGEILIDGRSLTGARGEARRRLVARIGFVFQQFNLIKRLSVLDNVLVGRLSHIPEWRSLVGSFPRRDRVLADEPMASLDPALSRTVMDLLRRINEEDGITVITTLHVLDPALAYGQRVIGLRGGRVVYDGGPGGITDEIVDAIFGEGAR